MNESPYVGILVGNRLYQNVPTKRTGYERLSFYEETAAEFGLTACFFRITDVQPGKRVTAYLKSGQGYVRQTIPLPKVIHNRTFFKRSSDRSRAEQLIRSGVTIFNACNRYDKTLIHVLLMQDENIRPHLPETLPARPDALKELMSRHSALMIKPVRGSIGVGIMHLQSLGERLWELKYQISGHRGRIGRIVFSADRLPRLLLNRIRKRKYLVQKRLPLATYNGCPFDLRVSVQRDATGEWQVTGIAGKVAKRGAYVTNVAQGGTVFPLSSLLSEYPHLDAAAVEADIRDLGLRIANSLSLQLFGLADLGLDIAITEQGYPMFIECNCRDQRYSFLEGGMPETWKATYRNPMGYAAYLLQGEQIDKNLSFPDKLIYSTMEI